MIPSAVANLPPLLSIIDAADAVGVSRRTIYNWLADGKIEAVFTASGARRIVTATLWRDEPLEEQVIATRGLKQHAQAAGVARRNGRG